MKYKTRRVVRIKRDNYSRECHYDVLVLTLWRLEIAAGIATSVVTNEKSLEVEVRWR